MKKMLSVLLAVVLVLAMAVTALAAQENTITATTPAANALVTDGTVDFDDLLDTLEPPDEEEPDVTITSAPSGVEYTVEGQTVTVDHEEACKVGYLDGDKYVAITATANPDGTYSFVAPEGVTDVIVVVKGDMNLDGVVDMKDAADLQRHVLKIDTNVDASALFAAEVTDDVPLDMEDAAKLTRYSIKVVDSLN